MQGWKEGAAGDQGVKERDAPETSHMFKTRTNIKSMELNWTVTERTKPIVLASRLLGP